MKFYDCITYKLFLFRSTVLVKVCSVGGVLVGVLRSWPTWLEICLLLLNTKAEGKGSLCESSHSAERCTQRWSVVKLGWKNDTSYNNSSRWIGGRCVWSWGRVLSAGTSLTSEEHLEPSQAAKINLLLNAVDYNYKDRTILHLRCLTGLWLLSWSSM